MTESLVKNPNNVVIVPAKKTEKFIQETSFEPPDGGTRAYLIMISAFMCNGILFGIINTYSVIYLSLQKSLNASGDVSASSKACKFQYRIFPLILLPYKYNKEMTLLLGFISSIRIKRQNPRISDVFQLFSIYLYFFICLFICRLHKIC